MRTDYHQWGGSGALWQLVDHRLGDHRRKCERVGRRGPGTVENENENNNVLKTKGYHLAHNFGHGKKHLSSLLLTMNLLAFGLHTLLEVTDASYRLVRAAVGARRKFFQHLEALTAYWYFENWERLMDFMMRGQEVGPYAAQKS